MAKLKWVIACERTILEEGSNVLSIIAMIEQVKLKPPKPVATSAKKPQMLSFRYTIIQYWTRSNPKKPERSPVRLKLIGANGKSYGSAEQVIDLTAHQNIRIMSLCAGFPLEPGKISAKVQIPIGKKQKGWRTVGQYDFALSFLESEPAPNAAARPTFAPQDTKH